MDSELWSEIHRRRRAGAAIKAIARELGVARNTVRRALAADAPPARRPRRPAGSIIDPYEPRILAELVADPNLTIAEIAGRIGWSRSTTVLKDRVRALRPIAARQAARSQSRSDPPVELTSFVGRDAELSEVREAIRGSRLTTLTGAGGVGKTRIAAQATRSLSDGFSDGVRRVELARLRQESLLAHAVLQAVGLFDRVAEVDPVGDLVEHLRDQQVLLVLDNCEHVRASAAKLLATLLAAAPRLRVLATSRQPLGLPGEHILPIAPLPVRTSDRAAGDRSRATGVPPAVALFRDRARAVVPDFTLTEDNLGEVTALCRRLDGIPLAIELAAARFRVLSIGDLLERVEDSVGVLADHERITDERHRTLEDTIAWSYRLCSPEEQTVWSRAAVFVGSYGLDALEAVCVGELDRPSALLDNVAALVDKSVMIREEAAGHVRFRMLETIRQFGLAQLPADRVTLLRTRHLHWYADLAEQLAQRWYGPDQLGWTDRMGRERDDLRIALAYGISEPRCHDVVLRLLGAPWFLWAVAFSVTEHRHWIDRALDSSAPDQPSRRWALGAAAFVATLQGDQTAARARLEEARSAPGVSADRLPTAFVRHAQGMASMFAGDLDEAESLLRAVRVTYGELDGPGHLSGALAVHLGLLYVMRGEFDRAEAVLGPVRRNAVATGERWVRSYALDADGFLALARDELATAKTRAHDALRLIAEFGDSIGLSLSLDLLAWTAAAEGSSERAAVLLGAAAALWQSFGHQLYGSADWQRRRVGYETRVRADLGEPSFDLAFRHGQILSRDDVLRYAFDQVRPPRLPSSTTVLTARELDIARRVATGLTNRDIAAELTVSPRTVEGHVSRILAKLGFTSRTQLAIWIDRNGRSSTRAQR